MLLYSSGRFLLVFSGLFLGVWFDFDVCVRFQRQLPVVPVVRHDEDEPSDVDSYEHDDDADASEARKRDRVARLIDDGASVDGDASDDEEDPAGVDAYEEEDASLAGEEEDGVVVADEYRRRQRHSAKRSHAAMERHVESLPRNVQGYQEVRFSNYFIVCLFVCLFVYLFVCLFAYLFVCLFVCFLFICWFAYLFIYLFVCLFVCLFVLF